MRYVGALALKYCMLKLSFLVTYAPKSKSLCASLFESISQVKEMFWFWRLDYNEERTHESLANLPPATHRTKVENSNLELCHLWGSGQRVIT